MDDTQTRLVKCFSSVFPSLPVTQIPNAHQKTVEGWDSLAIVTLLAVIEEEFRVEFDPEDLEYLVSFDSVLNYVKNHNGHSFNS